MIEDRRRVLESKIQLFIDDFITTKKIEGRAPTTVVWYTHMLKRFAIWMGVDATLKDLTVDRARDYVAELQARTTRYDDHPHHGQKRGGLSATSIHGYVRSLKVFSRWMFDEGYTDKDMFSRLRRPKLPQTVVDVLTDDEVDKIFADLTPGTFTGARNLAVYLMLFDTGIRASELCTLTLSNTDLKKGEIKVVGKGNKERIVSLVGQTRTVMLSYINFHRPQTSHDYVFTTFEGEPFSYSALIQMMKRLGRRLGIPRLHPHLFRHSFAVRWIMAGGNVIALQKTLGHTSLEVTKLYLHFSDMQMSEIHDQFSPAGKLNLKGLRKGK